MKITLRFPTAAYAYAEVEVEGDSGAELEYKLAEVSKAAGLAIQMTGGGDSSSIAERLLKDELGAMRVQESAPVPATGPGFAPATPAPWETPQASQPGPWDAQGVQATAPADPFANMAPPVPSSGPAPFGATPERDHFFVEVPRHLMDDWSGPKGPDGKAVKGGGIRGSLQNTGVKIGWDGAAKRNTIPKNTTQNILDSLRQRGYDLR